MLQGKKTYAVGAVSILGTLAAALAGQISYPDAAQLIVTAIMGMTVRHGVATEAQK